jgi:uncharacterized membrane protein YGL010W
LLLSHPALMTLSTAWGPVNLTLTALGWLLSTLWYLSRGLPGLGLLVSAFNGGLLCAATLVLSEIDGSGLEWGLAALCLGWLCQRAGHYYEGRKPSARTDAHALLIAPMFVVAEGLFALGRLQGLKADIEREAGPTRLRNLAMPAG